MEYERKEVTAMNKIVEKWFRSELACLKFLSKQGLVGRNGRVYHNGMILKGHNIYGQYSAQSWFVQLSAGLVKECR